jgi:hypothetical protein
MTARYTKQHYEDVARIISWHTTAARVDEDKKRMAELGLLCLHFADLFAADNTGPCAPGFNRAQFFAACGLES